MKRFVDDQGWPIPYLYDESQEVARALDAQVTPHVFVLDAEQRLRYRGAPDADHGDPSQNAQYLRDALDAVLAGDEPATADTRARGCSVKWKGRRPRVSSNRVPHKDATRRPPCALSQGAHHAPQAFATRPKVTVPARD